MLQTLLNVSQIVLAALLIACILLQARGAGLGAAFGGEGNVYRTKRGVEKRLYQATIAIAILFFSVAMTNVIV
jgi:preprotein translocase subunit SecG